MSGTDKTIEILIETERLADQILQNKQELVLLQQRTEDTRVAIRELAKGDEKKTWLTVGTLLIKTSKEEALQLLQKDKVQIDAEINKLRSDQKVLVSRHRDLELLGPMIGQDLVPLKKEEISAFRSNLPGF